MSMSLVSVGHFFLDFLHPFFQFLKQVLDIDGVLLVQHCKLSSDGMIQ